MQLITDNENQNDFDAYRNQDLSPHYHSQITGDRSFKPTLKAKNQDVGFSKNQHINNKVFDSDIIYQK